MAAPISTRSESTPGLLLAVIAPVAAISLFGLSLSMSYPLTSLILERWGESGAAIGLSATAAAATIVIGAPIMPVLLARFGLGPLMLTAAAVLSLGMLAFPALPDYWAWIAIRLVMGFAGAAIFFASEYWIVTAAPPGARGRAIALYTISLSVTFMLGPALVSATGVDGWLPFAIGSAVLAIGMIPVAFGMKRAPEARAEGPQDPRAAFGFFVSDPTILWGVVLFGTIEFGAISLLPVWGVRTGLTEGDSALLMAAFAAGSILCQWPTGWAADRYDRRAMLALAGALSLVAPLVLVTTAGLFWASVAVVMVWGGAAVALYSLALTELGARYSGTKLAQGNAAVVFGYGLGALVAPLGFGTAMDLVPPHGVLVAAAAIAGAYMALVLLRIAQSRRSGA